MPHLVRLYIRQVAIGFALSATFVAALLYVGLVVPRLPRRLMIALTLACALVWLVLMGLAGGARAAVAYLPLAGATFIPLRTERTREIGLIWRADHDPESTTGLFLEAARGLTAHSSAQ